MVEIFATFLCWVFLPSLIALLQGSRLWAFHGGAHLALATYLLFFLLSIPLILILIEAASPHVVPVTSIFPVADIVVISMGTVALIVFLIMVPRRGPHSISPVALSTLALISCYLASSMVLPVQGWDVLDHWGDQAQKFLVRASQGQEHPFFYEHRHPKTIPLLMAWFDRFAGSLETLSGAALPNIIFVFSIVLSLQGFGVLLGLGNNLSALAAFLPFSIPLFDNHIFGFGYGEIPVASCFLLSLLLLCIAGVRNSWRLLMLGVTLGLMPIALKNTGLFYSGIILFAGLLYFSRLLAPRTRAYLFSILLVLLVLAFTRDWGVNIFGQHLGFDSHTSTVYFASKQLSFSLMELDRVFPSIVNALFINMSFSVWVAVGLASCFFIITDTTGAVSRSSITSYLVTPYCTGLLVMSVSLLSDYGLRFGAVGSDTGHTRFHIPLVLLAIPLFMTLFAKPRSCPESRVVY